MGRFKMIFEVFINGKHLRALKATNRHRRIVELLGTDQVVDQEAHQALLGLGVLVASVAEELLSLLVEERAVDRFVRSVR